MANKRAKSLLECLCSFEFDFRDIKQLNAIALRDLGAEILDAFEVGDMAELA